MNKTYTNKQKIDEISKVNCYKKSMSIHNKIPNTCISLDKSQNKSKN